MAGAPLDIKVDASDFARLLGKTSPLEAKVKTVLRKQVRAAAEGMVAAARTEVLKPPPQRGKHPQNRQLRSSIAADIKVVLMANNAKGSGVVVKAGASRLDGDRKKLVRAYNSEKGWRHPVFARIHKHSKTGSALRAIGAKSEAKRFEKAQTARRKAAAKWVSQKGRHYFDTSIKHQPIFGPHIRKMQREIYDAMRAAIATLR